MRLTGRRESNNVEDRRGMGTGTKAGIGGIGGIIVIALITFLSGGNMGDVVNNIVQQQMQGQTEVHTGGEQHQFTEEEEKLADFSKQILAGTEDVWTEQFQSHGMRYHRCCTNCLWQWLCCYGSILLLCRPTSLPRLKFL